MHKNNKSRPILYSFRRCPFAIRARTAIYFSELKVELREVSLKNKPLEMLKVSPKATVPVLHYRNFHSTLFHSPRNKIIFYTFYKMIFCLNIKSKNAFTVYRFIAEMDEPVDKNCQKNIIPSISYIANKTIYGVNRGWNDSTECVN